MDLLSYLRTLKRHWVLILALCVAGAALGAASAELKSTTSAGSHQKYYKATTTLIIDMSQRSGEAQPAFQNLDQIAVFATTGDVPNLVAKALGSDQSGTALADRLTIVTNGSTNTIALTAVSPTAEDAVRVSDTFASQLSAYLLQKSQDLYAKSRDLLTARLDSLQATENSLLAQMGASPRPANFDDLQAQYSATNNQYRITYDSYAQLAAQGPPTDRFSVLQKAEPVTIDKSEYEWRLGLGTAGQNEISSSSSSGLPVPPSAASSSRLDGPVARGLLGAIAGLLLGIGLAFFIERLDRRIRTRPEAEAAFGLPVLAEVPMVTRDQARSFVIGSAVAPLSRMAEAHRAVRSSLLFSRAAMTGATSSPGPGAAQLFEPAHDEPFVLMVTSASPSEGKTSTTANLAAVFAEAGASVLVVNCDFRRPALHEYFGVRDEPRRVHETNIPGVKIVTNVLTDPAANPSQVVAAQRQVVAAARGRFDVILLDTAPLLTANDAVEIVGSADLVLLVARLGVTRTDNAQQVMELLGRLDVPLGGIVLLGAQSATNDYYYYYQPGRVEHGEPRSTPDAKATQGAGSAGSSGSNGHANGAANGRATAGTSSNGKAEATASAELFGEGGQTTG